MSLGARTPRPRAVRTLICCAAASMLSVIAPNGVGSLAAAQSVVVNVDAVRPFYEAARTQRVDIVGIGDSNQIYRGSGWDEGWHVALGERFNSYATGVVSVGDNYGRGSGAGYEYEAMASIGQPAFLYADAPAGVELHLNNPPSALMPLSYVYVEPGVAYTAAGPFGMVVRGESSLDVSAALRWTLWYAKFAGNGSGGTFTPTVRLEIPPFTTLARSQTVLTWAGTGAEFSVGSVQLQLPADPARSGALSFRPVAQGESATGPFAGYYMRVENPARATGTAVSVLYALGSQSLRDMAGALAASSDETLTLYFSAVRAGQGDRKRVLVRISSGLNDRAEPDASIVQGIVPGSSPAAYEDNLRYIMLRLTLLWQRNSWDAEELYFVLAPSHPVSDEDDPLLIAYRERADALALTWPRTASVRLDRLTNSGEMLASGWYQSGGSDRNHLTRDAYVALASRELLECVRPSCTSDFNGDGGIDGGDVEAFFTTWSRGDFVCDLNQDGGVDGRDAEVFLVGWVAASC
jgi:hypothetical protein